MTALAGRVEGAALTNSSVLEQVRTRVELDKRLAGELLAIAREKARVSPQAVFVADITGSPRLADRQRFIKTQRQALDQVQRDVFFCSVETAVTDSRSGGGSMGLLISKARETGGVWAPDDSWALLSWTSPLTSKVLGCPVGETVRYSANSRHASTYKIKSRCAYGAVLPSAQSIRFESGSSLIELTDERELGLLLTASSSAPGGALTEVVLPAMEPAPYQAEEWFGLDEIIAEADAQQRFAMHLPLDRHVLIQGPPGSGKTSIALMRIPCLLDAQWEFFGLNPETDAPFYTESDCRILVVTEQMVQYLEHLRNSLGIGRVRCMTFADLYRRLCRAAGTIAGKPRPDRRALRRLKGRPEALQAAWAGFRAHVEALWERQGDLWQRRMLDAGGADAATLIRSAERWVERVQQSAFSLTSGGGLSFAREMASWLQREQGRRSDTAHQGAGLEELRQLAEVVRRLGRALADRAAWTSQMLLTREFEQLESIGREELGTEALEGALDQWEEMATGETPTFDEADLAISGWLALKVFSTSEGRSFRLGCQEPTFRHLVIDEAQDMTHAHAATLPWLLDQGGTMTIAGDLRQVMNEGGGLSDWSSLAALSPEARTFELNYRQSFELGEFVRKLYQELFDETPAWSSCPRRRGPSPRVVIEPVPAKFGAAVAAEILSARRSIQGATVAVVFDGPVKKDRLRRLQDRIHAEIEDEVVEVYLTGTREGHRHLRKTDCVHILPVTQTKGLEYDAVVLADVYGRFAGTAVEMLPERRNRLYVAASRAQQWFSAVLRSEPGLSTLRS